MATQDVSDFDDTKDLSLCQDVESEMSAERGQEVEEHEEEASGPAHAQPPSPLAHLDGGEAAVHPLAAGAMREEEEEEEEPTADPQTGVEEEHAVDLSATVSAVVLEVLSPARSCRSAGRSSPRECLACGGGGCSLCRKREMEDPQRPAERPPPPAEPVEDRAAAEQAARLAQLEHTRELKERRERERKVAVRAFLQEHGFRGVKVPKRNMLKATYALHRAVERGIPHIVGMLLEEGADPSQKDSAGMTAAQIAREKDKDGSHAGVLHMLSRWDLPHRGGQRL